MNSYEQQAIDFLKKTNTEINIEYSHSGKHFEDDKEARDIYNITIRRGRRSFSLKFGNSLNNSGFYYTKGVRKIELDRKYLDKNKFKNLGNYIKRKIDWDFLNNGKSDVVHYPKEPTVYDVLTCLEKCGYESFEDFCGCYGYDTDSRRAEKIYKACVEEYNNVCNIWSDEEIELLKEIQ